MSFGYNAINHYQVTATFGPWRADISAKEICIWSIADRKSIAKVSSRSSRQEEVANANLLAAAPEMYAALSALKEACMRAGYALTPEIEAPYSAAVLALSMAKGES